MFKLVTKENYSSQLSPRETEKAIILVKSTFQEKFAEALGLERVSAPLFVTKESGLNDDLNGVERKVNITFNEMDEPSEIVQSLAKWKRFALYKYGFKVHEGLYTDMNAVRRDDKIDNTHSVYVDQWDWEMVISSSDRSIDFLKKTVIKIVASIYDTQVALNNAYPIFSDYINKDIFFITTQELEDKYPTLCSTDRENAITKEYGTVFIMKIGDLLRSGQKHDGRAPDYDDWALNGDIFVWDKTLGAALELSSMGIRVDEKSLLSQLKKTSQEDRLKYDYHKRIVDGTLPLTIGGGIGQSRLCMYLLEKLHIGEVQVSVWPEKMLAKCKELGINIL